MVERVTAASIAVMTADVTAARNPHKRQADRMRGATLRAVLSVLALALPASSCATTAAPKGAGATPATAARGGFGEVMYGQESGLGVTGSATPQALKLVAAAPYALPPAIDCAALSREIASLDDLLGPDVDILADPKAEARLDEASRALGSALRGAIPYRWALRWLTQAGDRDKELREAVLAGAARRGFLKGMRLTMACPIPVSPLLAPQGIPANASAPPKAAKNGG